jgi:hypothetical protein
MGQSTVLASGLVQEGGGSFNDRGPGGIGGPRLRLDWPWCLLEGLPQRSAQRSLGIGQQYVPWLPTMRRIEKVEDLLDRISERDFVDVSDGAVERRHFDKKGLPDLRQPDTHCGQRDRK